MNGIKYIGTTKVTEFIISNKYNLTLTGVHGTTTGSGLYNAGTYITIEATPDIGYNFARWSDGNDDNPRTFKIVSEQTLEAIFEEKGVITYTATEDLRTLAPQQLGVVNLVQDSCTYNSETGEGKLMYSGDITTLQDYAFQGLTQLTSVELPNTVLTISNYSFSGCTCLTEFTVPRSVTTLGQNICSGCGSINTIKYKAIKCVGSTAYSPFVDIQSQITKILFYDGVTVIPHNLCHTWTNIHDIRFPNTVTIIGNASFFRTSISSLTLPDNISYIDNNSFSSISTLQEVYIPKSFKQSNANSFSNCINIKNVYYEGTLEDWLNIVFYDGGNPTYFGKASLYIQGKKLKGEVIIPNTITRINNNAFCGIPDITSIVILDSVISIGNHSFNNCSSLTSVTIPNSVTSIGYSAFRGCSGLTSVTIPNSVTSIGERAFFGCSGLTSITIPSGVTIINTNTFYGCTSLKEIIVPDTITTIGYQAMSSSGITSLYLPDSVTYANQYCFYNCRSLSKVRLSDNLVATAPNMFQQCVLLSDVYIGKNTTHLNRQTFQNCAISAIELPDALIYIGPVVFGGCVNLQSLYTNKVQTIDNNAFEGCTGLQSVTIGSSLQTINANAFYLCSGLITINYEGTIEQWNAVDKVDNWHNGVHATEVHCTDGDVSLN